MVAIDKTPLGAFMVAIDKTPRAIVGAIINRPHDCSKRHSNKAQPGGNKYVLPLPP